MLVLPSHVASHHQALVDGCLARVPWLLCCPHLQQALSLERPQLRHTLILSCVLGLRPAAVRGFLTCRVCGEVPASQGALSTHCHLAITTAPLTRQGGMGTKLKPVLFSLDLAHLAGLHPRVMVSEDPGRGRPCSATGPTPAADPVPAPALTGGLSSGSSLDARTPVKWAHGGRQTRPLGAWGTLLPPSAPPSHPAHLKSAPRLGPRTAEDLPQGPLPSRPLASIYRVEPLPVRLLVHLFKLFKHVGALPKGRGEEEGTCGQQVGSLGADPFSWRPQISTSLQEAFQHGPEPWGLRGLGRGLLFPPGASIPSSPGGESALGQVAVLGAETSCCRTHARDLPLASPHT